MMIDLSQNNKFLVKRVDRLTRDINKLNGYTSEGREIEHGSSDDEEDPENLWAYNKTATTSSKQIPTINTLDVKENKEMGKENALEKVSPTAAADSEPDGGKTSTTTSDSKENNNTNNNDEAKTNQTDSKIVAVELQGEHDEKVKMTTEDKCLATMDNNQLEQELKTAIDESCLELASKIIALLILRKDTILNRCSC